MILSVRCLVSDKLIVDSTWWHPLTDFPTCTSYREMSEKCYDFWDWFADRQQSGVYQVSLSRPSEWVHKDICYIGESTCLPKRISDLRCSAGKSNKNTHHNCGVYIREEAIDINSVYVRALLTNDKQKNDKQKLERYLHDAHRNEFGYAVGYKWEEASGGYKSCRIQSQVNIKRLKTVEDCLKVQKVLAKRIKELKKVPVAGLHQWLDECQI